MKILYFTILAIFSFIVNACESCSLDRDNKPLVTGIANAFANAPESYVSVMTKSIPKSENINISKIKMSNGQTIEQYTQSAFSDFLDNATVTEDKGELKIIGLISSGGCQLKGVKGSSTFIFTNASCLSPIKYTIDDYLKQKNKIIIDNTDEYACNCFVKFLNSSVYKSWLQERQAFVNKRFRQCVDNGYSTSACGRYRENDISGYANYKSPPVTNCPDPSPGTICTGVNNILILNRLKTLNSR